MFRYLSLFCLQLGLLLGDVLGNASIKPRAKRASHHRSHSSKLSVKDLALELAKKHLLKMIIDEQHDLDKAKESIYILERDHCTNIKSVGKPVTHNARYYYQGAWMKDPLGIMGVIHKTYKLPYTWDGTEEWCNGPFLYYNRANTPYIVKYNLKTERVEAQISVSGYTARRNYYQWGGYSGMDLAVDEQGCGNVVTHTYTLGTEPMSSMGNAFVACGVIYCIDNYNSKPTTINFAYDTKTGKQWNPNIQFTNQYGYLSMVDYNPREKVLYAWNARRQVTYPLTFEETLDLCY
ncbi:Olfactomedin-like domain [Desmophyllum pertusum]|uniref:Olfactomedin-like domain n=1 Tax=Desmophyllum pertusum TaxID=174260 RepID=A0A9W9YTF9_9CNID|nr:Olfactomedin-like domain [Desmophyllum pertusum]